MTDRRVEFVRRCLAASERHVHQDYAKAEAIRDAWGLRAETKRPAEDSRLVLIEAHRAILETCEHYLHEYEAGTDPCANSVLDALVSAYKNRSAGDLHAWWGPT